MAIASSFDFSRLPKSAGLGLGTRLFEAYNFKRAAYLTNPPDEYKQYYYSFNFKDQNEEYYGSLRKIAKVVVEAVKADMPGPPAYTLPTPVELVETFEQPMSWSRVDIQGHAVATIVSARENGIYTLTFIVRTCPKSS